MIPLTGNWRIHTDNKGRFKLPADLRKQLGDNPDLYIRHPTEGELASVVLATGTAVRSITGKDPALAALFNSINVGNQGRVNPKNNHLAPQTDFVIAAHGSTIAAFTPEAWGVTQAALQKNLPASPFAASAPSHAA